MRIKVSYNDQIGGHLVSLDNGTSVRDLALLNGNRPDLHLPVVIYCLDAHVVFAMSHPSVISRILSSQPQPLLTSRDMAHKLFEHGMKASLSKQMMGSSPVLTTLDTYYRLTSSIGPLSLSVHNNGSIALTIKKEVIGSGQDFILAGRGFPDGGNGRLVYFEDLSAKVCVFDMHGY